MIILITNDDGIYSHGIKALKEALSDLGDVWVVAPSGQQSGVSHSFSFFRPLRVHKIKSNGSTFGYAVDGTPADAAKIALRHLLPEKPALVLSGINNGENNGINIMYSGTVAGAMEGALVGVPSIAVSQTWSDSEDYAVSARVARYFAEKTLNEGLPYGTMLNVNVPMLPFEQIKGIRVVEQAESFYADEIERRKDPRGTEYYWIGGTHAMIAPERESDMTVIKNGYVTVTPISARATDHRMLSEINGWGLALESR